MKIKKNVTKLIGLLCLCFIMFLSAQAFAGEGGVKVGTLTIKAIPGSGHNLLINSSVDVNATFTDEGGKTEHYIGEMGVGLGIDLRYKKEEEIGYLVFSPSTAYKTGSYALQGKYFGATAAATVGAGATAKVLIGGFEDSFTLQPVMLGGNTGFGASGGLGYLFLQKAPK